VPRLFKILDWLIHKCIIRRLSHRVNHKQTEPC
jgi:hypothetical protein